MIDAAVLRTGRLLLTPVQPADADAIHALFQAPSVYRYLCDGQIMPREWVEGVIAQSQGHFAFGDAGLWTLCLKGTPVGVAGFHHFADSGRVELIYAILPEHEGRGLVTEAAQAVIDYRFRICGADEIVACADLPNRASFAVMRRLGMTFTHRMRAEPFDRDYYVLKRS